MAVSALERYRQKKKNQEDELASLKEEVTSELAKRRSELKEQKAAIDRELEALDREYEEIVGRTARGQRVKRGSDGAGSKADFGNERELEEVLKSSDGHKMNRKALNAAGYNLVSAVKLAKSNPKKFGQKQNKAQGEVWLIK